MSTRYLIHYYVDFGDKTTVFTDTNDGTNGKIHPLIRGLDVKFWDIDESGIDYCLSVLTDDSVVITESPGLQVVDYNSWADKVQNYYNKIITVNNLNSNDFVLDKTSLETIIQSFDYLYSSLQEQ